MERNLFKRYYYYTLSFLKFFYLNIINNYNYSINVYLIMDITYQLFVTIRY